MRIAFYGGTQLERLHGFVIKVLAARQACQVILHGARMWRMVEDPPLITLLGTVSSDMGTWLEP